MATTSNGLDISLALGAAGSALAWLLLSAAVVSTRRPPRIRVRDATMELPPEPPAVAGLLASDFVVPGEAAPATLLDLAARRVIDLDEVQPGNTIARVRPHHDESLSPYEQRVVDELDEKAIDGVVPTEAMTTGPEAQSSRWQRDLVREVVEDAQRRGLTTNRWTPRILWLLGIALAPAIGCLYFAIDSGDDGADDWLGWLAGGIALAVIVFGFVALSRMSRSLAQLPTESGLSAAARAVGLEHHLHEDGMFAELPPAAVKIRGRHFAYAAAFGLSPVAMASLPMGAEDDHRAWSRVGGRWRRVHVRYPRAWPPAWGKHPAIATLLAIAAAGVAGFALWGLVQLADSERPSGISSDSWHWVQRGALITMIPFALATLWAALVAVRAVPDFWSTRHVSGEIVRARRRRQWLSSGDKPKYWNYLAVDDGTSDRVVALRLRELLWREHNQGEQVTVDVTPRLGYVRAMRTATVTPIRS